MLVFLVLAAVAIVAFLATRHVVADQEDRLLHEQAVEVQAVIAGSVGALESSLKVLGPVGAAGGPQAEALFRRTAANQLGNETTAFGVVEMRQGRPTVVVEVGDGPAVGETLTGERRALFQRALGQDKGRLVSDIVGQKGQGGDATSRWTRKAPSAARASGPGSWDIAPSGAERRQWRPGSRPGGRRTA